MSKEYLKEAYEFAVKNSTDKSTQNGAVLVDGLGRIVAWGANHFPRGVEETPERLERPTKYLYVVHAEESSIFDATRRGIKTDGLVMYGTWVACNDCAKAIIESGIVKVVGHKKTMDAAPERWLGPIRIAEEMFKEAGITYEMWEGDIGGIEILFNEKPFSP
jgi:dCMP deaminase